MAAGNSRVCEIGQIALAIGLAVAAAGGAQAKSRWINKEFFDTSAAPLLAIETYLNESCRPSGLDGIQLLGVQSGHGTPYHLHVYCRADGARVVYRVRMAPIAPNDFDPRVMAVVVDNPRVRVGPFYFGLPGESDGFLVVEKTK